MNAPKPLPQNDSRLGRAAHKRLMEAREHAPPHNLHLLTLASWGLENGADGEWPCRDRDALEQQVALLFGWKPENVLRWLFNNPNGPDDPKEQEENLLTLLHTTDSPKGAAANILNEVYSRQVADNPALQPAASELP